MKKLHCDIGLGGSTKQMLEYEKRNHSKEVAIANIAKRLEWKCRKNPARYARRCACLIGLIYDQLDGDQWLLDVVITAMEINELTVFAKGK